MEDSFLVNIVKLQDHDRQWIIKIPKNNMSIPQNIKVTMMAYDSVAEIFGRGKNCFTALDDVSSPCRKRSSGVSRPLRMRRNNNPEAYRWTGTLTRGTITIEGQNIMDPELSSSGNAWDMSFRLLDVPRQTHNRNIAVVPKLLRWDEERISMRLDELLQMTESGPWPVQRPLPR